MRWVLREGAGYGAIPGDDGSTNRGNARETILPTLEALSALKERGVVLDGGYPSGKRSIMLIVEADSEERVREMLEGVPGWEAETTEVSRLHTLDELSDRRNLRAG